MERGLSGQDDGQKKCQPRSGVGIEKPVIDENQVWSSIAAPGAEFATLFMPLLQPDSDA
jgi:hypothetical protein